MSRPVTDSTEIQLLLEDRLQSEERRSTELKKRIADLKTQMKQTNLLVSGNTEVTLGDDVTLSIGASRKQGHINTSCNFASFVKFVQLSFSFDEKEFGFRDDQGRIVYLQSNQDIKFMFTWYFAHEVKSIQIVSIPFSDIAVIKKRKMSKEVPYKDGSAVFRCEICGPEKPLFYLVVPPNYSFSDGMNYLQGIFGKISSLMFADDDEDIITVDSNESWGYCIGTGIKMSKIGRYQLLLIQTSN
ncbi:hypothetical protein GPJ56_007782 [Histomonas meleagridis]|uniref:uncharacterized protein n=1 Tax=Histomonas meleagridis TaxID=135588 RepID=UPI0035593ACA|nr:hypothetical protein GPJ56_007782 [Histomonas meleagridis]KAH0798739.1 hypothetical protein GO595_008604 [Histomonas meleagridis]